MSTETAHSQPKTAHSHLETAYRQLETAYRQLLRSPSQVGVLRVLVPGEQKIENGSFQRHSFDVVASCSSATMKLLVCSTVLAFGYLWESTAFQAPLSFVGHRHAFAPPSCPTPLLATTLEVNEPTSPAVSGPVELRTTHRAGGWLPKDSRVIDQYLAKLKKQADAAPKPLVEPVQTLKEMVYQDSALNDTVNSMFDEAWLHRQTAPLDVPVVRTFDDFLGLLNHIVTSVAPEYTYCSINATGFPEPCGLIGFPINALLDWQMATKSGYVVFSNSLINQQLHKILTFWTGFLTSTSSTNVLTQSYPKDTPPSLAWLSAPAREELVVANNATGAVTKPAQFQDIFVAENPGVGSWGYKSWDDFFTRKFVKGVRPVSDQSNPDVLVNACESAPLQVKTNVQLEDKFWLKGQPYSLQNMMNFHPSATGFVGGTVYQAFLSALSYHRWHCPVDGNIVDAFVVEGSYYLENRAFSFENNDPDPSGPNDSQPFLSAVATRAVIFIEADSPKIGLMCFIAIGMAEVGSCEITAKVGQRIYKGEQLGMFHFGGSTHCLCFRKGVNLNFINDIKNNASINATNIAINSKIAQAY